MIQELLGFSSPPSAPLPSFSSSSSSTAAPTDNPNNPTNNSSNSDKAQNLRCPRCNSSNTKFCYYNNYNLTQPRHFCKTCRRYWTKGGALRNIPIGGGCRKNKNLNTTLSTHQTVRSNSGNYYKMKLSAFEHEPRIQSSSSHLLALLRQGSQNPNSTPNPNVYLWRNPNENQQNRFNFIVGQVVPSNGFQDQCQRLRLSSTVCCYNDQPPVVLSDVISSGSSSSLPLLESVPAIRGADQSSYNWINQAFSFPDVPTINGSVP